MVKVLADHPEFWPNLLTSVPIPKKFLRNKPHSDPMPKMMDFVKKKFRRKHHQLAPKKVEFPQSVVYWDTWGAQ